MFSQLASVHVLGEQYLGLCELFDGVAKALPTHATALDTAVLNHKHVQSENKWNTIGKMGLTGCASTRTEGISFMTTPPTSNLSYAYQAFFQSFVNTPTHHGHQLSEVMKQWKGGHQPEDQSGIC